MRTYLALFWNSVDQSQQSSATDLKSRVRQRLNEWSVVFEAAGAFICLAPPATGTSCDVYYLSRGQGIVLGRLFPKDYTAGDTRDLNRPRPVVMHQAFSDQIVADAGATLCSEFWGAYIAFLTSGPKGRHCVLRDPTGQFPCQRAEHGGISAYFASMEDWRKITSCTLRVNEHFLIGCFAGRVLDTEETGYDGISTVLPGQRVEYDGTRCTRSFVWNSVELASSRDHVDPTDAKLQTRRIVRSCVHAWASCFDSIYLQLSGGLDSTIVAACLADAPTRPRVFCVNFYSRSETSDERS